MAGCWADLERPARDSDNLPRRGESLWTRKKEFTWRTRATAASWSCRCHETTDALRCFPAGRDLNREFARRNVSPVANALFYAGGVCASRLRSDCIGAPQPVARGWPGVPDHFNLRNRRIRGGGALRYFSPAVCVFKKLGTRRRKPRGGQDLCRHIDFARTLQGPILSKIDTI